MAYYFILKQGTKAGNLTVSAKVEFASTLLGESPKVELNAESGFYIFDFICHLKVCDSDPFMLDEIAQTPIVGTSLFNIFFIYENKTFSSVRRLRQLG